VVWVRLPEMPVTVTTAGPTVALLDAVSVKVLVLVVLEGLKDAVTPAGRPLADKLAAPENPPMSVRATVLMPLAPWTTAAGEAERE
jgi:hypothetical protein